jgi:hypothetical protein
LFLLDALHILLTALGGLMLALGVRDEQTIGALLSAGVLVKQLPWRH